jgi:hypothetical protein
MAYGMLQNCGWNNLVLIFIVWALIEGEPPIYVGIYIDDIIYLSTSDAVKWKFESLLPTIGDVDFMSQVFHFLGIEFN